VSTAEQTLLGKIEGAVARSGNSALNEMVVREVGREDS
jgi:hypothetical protein